MAKLYGHNDAVDFAAANLVSFGGSFTRLNGQPLDKSSVWYPAYVDLSDNWKVVDPAKVEGAIYKTGLERATNYAASNAAFVGQELAIIDVTYEEDNTTIKGTSVKFYGIQDATGTLKELGAKPTSDNATISVDAEGLISIFGFAGAQNNSLPVRENGALVWKTLEDIGAGDGNDNTTYEFELTDDKTGIIVTPLFNGQPIMEGEEGAQKQKKFELTLDVYTKAEVNEAIKAVADKVDTGEQTVSEYVATEIGKKVHIRTEVVEVVPSIDTAEEGVIYLVADENSAAGTYLEYILVEKDGVKSVEQIGDTTTDLSNYYNKDQIDEIVAALPDTNTEYTVSADTSETKVKVVLTPTEGDAQEAELDAYNTTTMDKKLYEGSYTSSEGEVVSNITSDKDKARLISSEEIKKLAGLVIDEDGGVGISGTVNAENVEGLTDYIASQVTGAEGLNIESGAEKNIIEQIKVNGTVITPSDTRSVDITVPTSIVGMGGYEDLSKSVTTNTNDITALKAQIGTTGTNVSSVVERLAALEAEIGTDVESRIDVLVGVTTQHTSSISTNTAEITKINTQTLPALQQAIEEEITDITNAIGVPSNAETGVKASGVYAAIEAVADTIDFSPYATKAALEEEIARADKAEKANAAAISALIGEDTDKTIRTIAAEELATIVNDNNNGSIDTLNEIANWIINDTTGAAAMANDITALKTTVGDTQSGLVKAVADNTAAIAAIIQPKASAEVTVAEDGTLGLGQVSTDRLVQGTETLVLKGGSATGFNN